MERGDRRSTLFDHLVRLRRVARHRPGDRDLAEVRAWLEAELGETVSRRFAARTLGVSHTALERWIQTGDIPTVYTSAGRVEIPVAALLDLYERVEQQRRSGTRTRHLLEPVMSENRNRALELRPLELVADVARGGGHRIAEIRSLAYHRALARRLGPEMVSEARQTLWKWLDQGRIDRRYAQLWEKVLVRPIGEIKLLIGEDTDLGRDLRQNSPFSGMLSEPERRRIVQEVR